MLRRTRWRRATDWGMGVDMAAGPCALCRLVAGASLFRLYTCAMRRRTTGGAGRDFDLDGLGDKAAVAFAPPRAHTRSKQKLLARFVKYQ